MAFLPAIQSLLGLGLVAVIMPTPSSSQEPAEDKGLPNLSLTQRSEDFEDAFDEVSSWQMHLVQKESEELDLAKRGAFPVGDGEVFGSLGLGRRANTMRGLTGPGYATRSVPAQKGQFGEWTLDLIEGGKTKALESQHLWRLRGCNVVVSSDRADGQVALHTVNFAKAGSKTLYRWIEVQNLGDQPRQLVLKVDWAGAMPGGQERLLLQNATEGRQAELAASIPGKASKGQLLLDLGTIEGKKSKTLTLHLRMSETGKPFSGPEATEKGSIEALQASIDGWMATLAGTTSMSSDRQELADLSEDWKVLMLVQRSSKSGAVVPMIGHRKSRIAENNGALLTLLRYGLFKEAKQLLDYHVKAAVQSGRLEDELPAELDLSQVQLPTTAEGWQKIQVPENEMAAWLILQHEWYLRATWDKSILMERWPFFTHLLASMRPDGKGSLPVSGKESYMQDRWMRLAMKSKRQSFLPADGPGRHARSFDNSTLHLLSLNAMSELGEEYDKVRAGEASKGKDWKSGQKSIYESLHLEFIQKMEATFWLEDRKRFAPFVSSITGQPHGAPFALVNLRQQWIGYTYSIGEHNRLNLRHTLAELWQNSTRIGMTPTVGYAPGDLQGYLLYSLADLDDQNRANCLDELLTMATPSGGWAEFYGPRGHPVDPDDSDYPQRMRPSEAGINLDAIAFSLNGIRYVVSPGWSKKDQRFKLRLPNRSRWLSMKNLRHDGHQFHVFLDERFVKDLEIDKSGKPVRKMRFRVRYVTVNRELGMQGTDYVDTAINVGEEVYVRYPSLKEEVNETGMWPVDKENYLRSDGGPGPYKGSHIKIPEESRSLVITSSMGGSRLDGAHVIDIGLPYLPSDIAKAILSKKGLERILFDVGSRELSKATQKGPGFWNDASLQEAATKFVADGGKVIAPVFIRIWGITGPLEGTNAADNLAKPENFAKARSRMYRMEDSRLLKLALALPKTKGKSAVVVSSLVHSEKKRECTLRLGSSDHMRVWLNGKLVHENKKARIAQADQDETLVTLQKGDNQLVIEVHQVDGNGQLYARFTDLQTLPIPTLSYK